MKFAGHFRSHSALARGIASRIHNAVELRRRYRLMEFCGGHTHVIRHHGLASLLPQQIELLHGPNCPVSVLPSDRIDNAIELAIDHGVMLCTYGNALHVMGSQKMCLDKARAAGADVRTVDSVGAALALAREHSQREIVFFGVGFETAAPSTALALTQARAESLDNFSVLCNHVLTPAGMRHLVADETINDCFQINGFIGPSHVSTVIGVVSYRAISRNFVKPVVIAGFEPLDVLQAILMLVEQINECRADTENQFTRAVSEAGNTQALALMNEVFEVRESLEWRGLGEVPHSALAIRPAFARWDAERRYALVPRAPAKGDGLSSGACRPILRGCAQPTDCSAFGTACTPVTPLGVCMASSQAVCAEHYRDRHFVFPTM